MNTIVARRPPSPRHPTTDLGHPAPAWLHWRTESPEAPQRLTIAELDECRCPGLCNRDHVNE